MRPDTSVPWWALLLGAVATEVAGTASLRLSEGFTRPVFALGVLAGYAVSIVLFARVLDRGVGLGLAYGTLTATGLLAATGLSALAFGEPVSAIQLGGLLLLLAGLLALQLPGRRRERPAEAR